MSKKTTLANRYTTWDSSPLSPQLVLSPDLGTLDPWMAPLCVQAKACESFVQGVVSVPGLIGGFGSWDDSISSMAGLSVFLAVLGLRALGRCISFVISISRRVEGWAASSLLPVRIPVFSIARVSRSTRVSATCAVFISSEAGGSAVVIGTGP